MDLMKAMELAAKGMKAQGVRMKVISENLANAETTGTKPGDTPYRRQVVTFKNELNRADNTRDVEVDKIVPDNSDFVLKYDPSHPAADAKGYVKYPNVDPEIEAMDMREAQRSYEANLNVISATRQMLGQTLDILKG